MKRLRELGPQLLASPALVYLVATLLSRLGGFLLIPLYTRRLTEAEYGEFSVAQTAVSLLAIVCTLGLGSTLPRAFFAQKDERLALQDVGSIARTIVGLAAAACGGIVVVSWQLGRTAGLFSPWAAACISVAVIGTAVSAIPDTLLRARRQPYRAAMFQLAQFAFAVSTGIIFVRVLGRGLRGALEALAVSNAISGALALAYIHRELPGPLNRAAVRAAVIFSLPLIPHFLAVWSQHVIDRWVLKGYGLSAQLGNYALATQLIAPITMAVSAWNDMESARLGAVFRDGGIPAMLAARRRLYAGYLAVPVVLGAMVIVALPAVPWVLGRDRFSGALVLVPILVAVTIVEAMYAPSTNLLYYAGLTPAITFATFSSAALNVGLNVLLVPRFQLRGAIAARVIAQVFRSTLTALLANRLLHKAKSAPPAQLEPPTKDDTTSQPPA